MSIKKRYAIAVMTRGIGGAGTRFVYLFYFLSQKHSDSPIDLIINESKYQEMLSRGIPLDQCKNVVRLMDRGANGSWRYKFFYMQYAWYMCRNAHEYLAIHFVSAAYIATIPLFILKKLRCLKTRIGMTFASLSIPMAFYDYKPKKSFLLSMRLVDYIDQLNPGVQLPKKLLEKSTFSPCSFITYDARVLDCKVREKELAVCFVGAFEPIKSPLLLAEAMKFVLQVIPFVKFYFIGSGVLEEKLISIKSQLPGDLQGNVSIGYQKSPVETLKKTKIFCSLQTYTNYPSQALLEAMFARNFIIATDTGDTQHLLSDTSYCDLIDLRITPEALAERILFFLSLPEMQQNISMECSYQKASQFARIENYAKYFMNECMRVSKGKVSISNFDDV